MCGIVGYVGSKNGIDIVIAGLKRLEYRGYDSSGLCYFNSNKLHITKKKGKVVDLEELVEKNSFKSMVWECILIYK
jgi:glucosamine--fructose-6-phosphate aminotransferase (isomerizing)